MPPLLVVGGLASELIALARPLEASSAMATMMKGPGMELGVHTGQGVSGIDRVRKHHNAVHLMVERAALNLEAMRMMRAAMQGILEASG